MSFVTMHQALTKGTSHALFPELSVVETLHVVDTDDGQPVPAGSRGTIVAIWGDGQAYEVEFARRVATMRSAMLRAV